MKPTICYEMENGQYPIQLIQTGIDRFTVRYGLQVKKQLDYEDAATELGCCIMHKLACDSLLDNRRKGEK